MGISLQVQQCLSEFKSLQQHVGSDVHRRDDELDRFRIWCGNLSAHRPIGSRRSLEYRLRNSPNLRDQVLSLLTDLLEALTDAQNFDPAHASPDEPSGSDDSWGEHSRSSGDARATSEDGESPSFEIDELAVSPVHPMDSVHGMITLLYRFSMALRHPVSQEHVLNGMYNVPGTVSAWDISRVKSRYPSAKPHLIDRLARAMIARREYIQYRESHHSKLSAGLDGDTGDERQSTLATSLGGAQHDMEVAVQETESMASATSFAFTDSEPSSLYPPPLPDAGIDGDPFECPICFSIQSCVDERSWREHVFEDLRPYVCTAEYCDASNILYSRRRDWQTHQTKNHENMYSCSFGCPEVYNDELSFQRHLIGHHNHDPGGAAFTRLLKVCARPVEAETSLQCQLCAKILSSSKLWFRHMGRHMEQLALSSLPQALLVEKLEEADDGEVTEHGVRQEDRRTQDIDPAPAQEQSSQASSTSVWQTEYISAHQLSLGDLSDYLSRKFSGQTLESFRILVRMPDIEILRLRLTCEQRFEDDYVFRVPRPLSQEEKGSDLDRLRRPSGPAVRPESSDVATKSQHSTWSRELELKNQELDTLRARLQDQIQISMRREQLDRQKATEEAQASKDAAQRAIREAELEALKSLIKKHEDERDAREAAWRREREAEAAAKARKAESEAAEKRREEEQEAIYAKVQAEVAAKSQAEIMAIKEYYELRDAKMNEEASKRSDEAQKAELAKAPIRFKDAVGRKFSFPWHLCKTWKGMEGLIRQAFQHVDVIGEHVSQGHYDLTGPGGEIILPQVWDVMVKPDWEVSMHMWPFSEEEEARLAKPAPKVPLSLLSRNDASSPPALAPPARKKRGRPVKATASATDLPPDTLDTASSRPGESSRGAAERHPGLGPRTTPPPEAGGGEEEEDDAGGVALV